MRQKSAKDPVVLEVYGGVYFVHSVDFEL